MSWSVPKYIIENNIETEKLIRSNKICSGCGKTFSDKIRKSKKDKTICKQCQKAIDF